MVKAGVCNTLLLQFDSVWALQGVTMNLDRKINILKREMEYEKVKHFPSDILSPYIPYRFSNEEIPFVKTKERGYDRFYCMLEHHQQHLVSMSLNQERTIIHVYKVIAMSEYLYPEQVSLGKQKELMKQYFDVYLMESLL